MSGDEEAHPLPPQTAGEQWLRRVAPDITARLTA